MGHNFPAPTAEILSRPGALAEGMGMSAVLLICDTRHMMETSQLLWEF